MSNFNPLYDDGYFKCLLDIREFINNSEKVGIRGVKKQRNYIRTFIEMLLKNREARSEFMYYGDIGFVIDKDFNVIRHRKRNY